MLNIFKRKNKEKEELKKISDENLKLKEEIELFKNLLEKEKEEKKNKEEKIINQLKEKYRRNDFLLYYRTNSSIVYLRCKKWFAVYEKILKERNIDKYNYDSLVCLEKILFNSSCFLLNGYLKENLKDLWHIEWLTSSENDFFSKEGLKIIRKEVIDDLFIKPKGVVNGEINLFKRAIKYHLKIAFKNVSFDSSSEIINDGVNEIINLIMDIIEELIHLEYSDLKKMISENLNEDKKEIYFRNCTNKVYFLIGKKIQSRKEYIDSPLKEKIGEILNNLVEREKKFFSMSSIGEDKTYIELFERGFREEMKISRGNDVSSDYDDMIMGFF